MRGLPKKYQRLRRNRSAARRSDPAGGQYARTTTAPSLCEHKSYQKNMAAEPVPLSARDDANGFDFDKGTIATQSRHRDNDIRWQTIGFEKAANTAFNRDQIDRRIVDNVFDKSHTLLDTRPPTANSGYDIFERLVDLILLVVGNQKIVAPDRDLSGDPDGPAQWRNNDLTEQFGTVEQVHGID
jgi:hypothetical protein